jgi:hypothetical protein
MRSSYQYHKLQDFRCHTSRGVNKIHITVKHDNFKNRKFSKKSFIKEHIWYNLKNEKSIIISGKYINYTDNYNNIIYEPNEPFSLKLNDIPVSYINISKKNQNTYVLNRNGELTMMSCNLLYFCFDMSSYCDQIDLLLIMNKNKNRNNYFSYLPLEIIKYILTFI